MASSLTALRSGYVGDDPSADEGYAVAPGRTAQPASDLMALWQAIEDRFGYTFPLPAASDLEQAAVVAQRYAEKFDASEDAFAYPGLLELGEYRGPDGPADPPPPPDVPPPPPVLVFPPDTNYDGSNYPGLWDPPTSPEDPVTPSVPVDDDTPYLGHSGRGETATTASMSTYASGWDWPFA